MTEKPGRLARERRAFARAPYRIPCEFTHRGAALVGIVTDVSARGLFVETSSRVPSGAELCLLIRDPRGSYELRGHVTGEAWERPVRAKGLGLELANVPEPFSRLLRELGLA